MAMRWSSVQIVADPGLTIFTYTAEPGIRPADAVSLLGSWAATSDEIGSSPADRPTEAS